jgi:hypothetical protein
MTSLKTLSAIVVLSAAIATPAFAQDAGMRGDRTQSEWNFRQAHNQSMAPYLTSDEYRNLENFGFSGRDPSRVGGESPSLNPAN